MGWMEPEMRPRSLITLQQHVYSTMGTPDVHFSQISSSGTQILSVFICADDNKPM